MRKDPEAKGLEGFFGHVRCVACRVVVKEARNRDVVLPESWHNFSITVVNWWQLTSAVTDLPAVKRS